MLSGCSDCCYVMNGWYGYRVSVLLAGLRWFGLETARPMDSPGELPSARRAAPPPPQGMCNKLQVICHHTQPCTNRQMHASATTRAAFGRECAMKPIAHTRLQTALMMTGASRCTPFDHWLTCTRQEGMGHPLHIKVEYATLFRAYDRVLRVLCLRTRDLQFG